MKSINKELYNLEDTDLSFYSLDNETEIAERWDKKAQYWDQQFYDSKNNHLNQDNEYDRFIEVCKMECINKKIKNLVDVGCGTGLVLESLNNCYQNAVGIDISNEMIKLAKNKNIPNTKFYKANIFKIDKQFCNKFNMTISRGILISHYGEKYINKFLQILYNLTKDEGCVIFDFLNKNVNKTYQHLPQNKEYFSQDTIKSYALNNGFSRVNVIGEKSQRVLIGILYK